MTLTIDGATRLILIVGDPIVQVRSPAGISAALQARGTNTLCLPAQVAAADLPGLVAGVGMARNLDGIIATIPHKFACFGLCAAASPRARLLQSVNVMRRQPEGGWLGEMLDGPGFVGALRARGCEPQGRRALLVGAGGAGSAIALALLEAGVAGLAIHDTDTGRRDALIGKLRTVGDGRVGPGSPDPAGFELIAQATPAGMRPGDPFPIDPGRLAPSMFVGCVITSPAVSPLVAEARRVGCGTATGGDMFAAEVDLIVDFLLGGDHAARGGAGTRP